MDMNKGDIKMNPFSIVNAEMNMSFLLETIESTPEKITKLLGKFNFNEDYDDGYSYDTKVVQFGKGEKYTIYSRFGSFRIGGFGKGKNFEFLKLALEGK